MILQKKEGERKIFFRCGSLIWILRRHLSSRKHWSVRQSMEFMDIQSQIRSITMRSAPGWNAVTDGRSTRSGSQRLRELSLHWQWRWRRIQNLGIIFWSRIRSIIHSGKWLKAMTVKWPPISLSVRKMDLMRLISKILNARSWKRVWNYSYSAAHTTRSAGYGQGKKWSVWETFA